VNQIDLKLRNSSSWCLSILDLCKLSDSVFADISKLLTTVLFKSEKSPVLLLHVPEFQGLIMPPAGSPAFSIDQSHVKLLVRL
jgi:hypothetical protein